MRFGQPGDDPRQLRKVRPLTAGRSDSHSSLEQQRLLKRRIHIENGTGQASTLMKGKIDA